MVRLVSMEESDAVPLPNAWNPAHEAVWRENAPDEPWAIHLRHPTYPFEGPNQGSLLDDRSETLIDFAARYLRKVSSTLGLTAAAGGPDIFQPGLPNFVDA